MERSTKPAYFKAVINNTSLNMGQMINWVKHQVYINIINVGPLRTSPYVSFHLAVDRLSLIFCLINWQPSKKTVFLSSVNHSSKLMEPGKGITETSHLQSAVRNKGNSLDLWLEPEGTGGSLVGLSPNSEIWR